MLVETKDPIYFVDLEPELLVEARRQYPGYVAQYPDRYAAAWRAIAERGRSD